MARYSKQPHDICREITICRHPRNAKYFVVSYWRVGSNAVRCGNVPVLRRPSFAEEKALLACRTGDAQSTGSGIRYYTLRLRCKRHVKRCI